MANVSVGREAPAFELPDEQGKQWVLSEHLAKCPVVLVFYRGDW